MGCCISRRTQFLEADKDVVFPQKRGGRRYEHDNHLVVSDQACKGHNTDELALIDHGKPGSARVTETSSILGRAGVFGLDKAVDVLDTLGSSITSINFTQNSGFLNGVAYRGNKLVSILAFEFANTIGKAKNLMQSLSVNNIRILKTEILPSEGIQRLVSKDPKELLTIAAADKLDEFRMFSVEVGRFGDMCKDPQWHNLGRYFEKLDSDPTPREKLKQVAEKTMEQLIILSQNTSELYHELHELDRLEQDSKLRIKEVESLPSSQKEECSFDLQSDLKQQKKIVKNLKKKSLWSKTLEEVVEKLVEIVVFLHREILYAFDLSSSNFIDDVVNQNLRRLGYCGLSLHYANIINKIDSIVSRPMALPPNTRNMLYRGLPVGVKASLRSRLLSFHVDSDDDDERLSVSNIKAQMQKILRWIFPMAENTIRAQQGFGWVGEWANKSFEEIDMKSEEQNSMSRIETLHHADKEKTEEYILELAVYLHHLIDQVKNKGYGFYAGSTVEKSVLSSPESTKSLLISREETQLLEAVEYIKEPVLVRSKSVDFSDQTTDMLMQKTRLKISRSVGSSPMREFRERTLSMLLRFERRSILDVIDGVHFR